jgi:membrane protein implicated in regulation of membrane protease activity
MTEDLLDVGNAIVTEAITPNKTGKVRLMGLLWCASCSSNQGLQVGESVKVI